MNDAHTRETSSPASDPIPSSSRSQPTPSPQQQQQARDVNAVIAGKLADRKSLEFVKDALQQLDMLIYAHFCYMYYLDNSMWWFITRAFTQLNFLSPKPAALPLIPLHRLVIVGIFGTCGLSLLSHILGDAPSGSEALGGYLHGGVLIDFIGQEGPISKVRLAAMDVWILILQLWMLALNVSYRALLLKKPATQDHDSEERGVRASTEGERTVDGEDDGEDDEESPLFSTNAPPEALSRLWELYAGELIVADVDPIRIVVERWRREEIGAEREERNANLGENAV